MPHGITQCYQPPGRGDIPTLTPTEAGTRLSDPGGLQDWVDLVGLLHTEMVYPPKSPKATDSSVFDMAVPSIRKIRELPYRTHCHLLPLLWCRSLPIFDQLCVRSLNFVHRCLSHDSDVVKFISHYCIKYGRSNSCIGKNVMLCVRDPYLSLSFSSSYWNIGRRAFCVRNGTSEMLKWCSMVRWTILLSLVLFVLPILCMLH